MINQIEPVLKENYSLRGLSKGLSQARRIQARLKGMKGDVMPKTGILWSPLTGLPATVQVTRWIE
jgi:hypothetical protein